MTTDELIAKAQQALAPRDGQGGRLTQQQLYEADVHAGIATAQALNSIANALADIAKNTIA